MPTGDNVEIMWVPGITSSLKRPPSLLDFLKVCIIRCGLTKISMNLAPASLDKSQVISVSVWYLKFFKCNDIRLGMFHYD